MTDHTDMDPRFGRAFGHFVQAGGENKKVPESPRIRPAHHDEDDLEPDDVVGYGTD